MTSPPEKHNPTTFYEGESQKNFLGSEIREMVSALTYRLSDLQNQSNKNYHPQPTTKSHHHRHNHHSDTDDSESGVQVITLAGSNTGATMRCELDSDKSSSPLSTKNMDPTLGPYVNSNFQAINNSIMIGGSYSSNDPGVHIEVTDYEPEEHQHKGKPKGKKKEEGVSKADHHSGPNSD